MEAMKMNQIEIGKFIKRMRMEKALTQRRLAEILNISEKTVSKWERGCGMPDVGLMQQLCKCLGISLDELFSGEKLCEKQFSGECNVEPKENITLRHFENNESDLAVLKKFYCPDLSTEAISAMVDEWNSLVYSGKYFEMFAVVEKNGEVVGTISLYEHSPSVVSIGPEIFESFRNSGYGRAAMLGAIDKCKAMGFKIVCEQVRIDNALSIELLGSIGFETDNYVYKNRRSQDVILFMLSIV